VGLVGELHPASISSRVPVRAPSTIVSLVARGREPVMLNRCWRSASTLLVVGVPWPELTSANRQFTCLKKS
jgi:hypothetical protein